MKMLKKFCNGRGIACINPSAVAGKTSGVSQSRLFGVADGYRVASVRKPAVFACPTSPKYRRAICSSRSKLKGGRAAVIRLSKNAWNAIRAYHRVRADLDEKAD